MTASASLARSADRSPGRSARTSHRSPLSRALAVVRLQFVRKESVLGYPPLYGLGMVVLTGLIAIAMRRAGVDTSSADYAAGARNSQAAFWVIGFLGYIGVSAVGTTFAWGLALGTTRRHYSIGTGLSFVVLSAYTTAVYGVFLALEKATGHWWVNAYVFDTYMLGAGRWDRFVPLTFLSTLAVLCASAVFASTWVRFGSRGPIVLGLGLALLVAPHFELWWLYAALAALSVASIAGMYALLRRAYVR